jgi:hypothetical protein
MKPTPLTIEQQVRKARKLARDAQAHAEVVMANEAISRSTRTRTAYKHKATALDRVLAVLTGKE